ncbi:MAG: restriction endonuclease subunit S [Pirellulales bacterium]
MTPDRLLAHFNRICDAPDAIPRLRQFVLDLAVRGKLVDQDAGDERAQSVLDRVEQQKLQLLKNGEVKKFEVLNAIPPREIPFDLPSGWSVVRLGTIARKLGAGSTPLGGKSVYQAAGVKFLRSQNVHNDGLRLDDVALIPRSVHERMSGTHVQRDDVLLNITGASIGRCALVPAEFDEGNVSQHVAIIRLHDPGLRGFIHLSLISSYFQRLIDDVQVGVSREGLSMQQLRQFPMPIPPRNEQSQIIAKVDALMALCDELEAAQGERERRRDRLAGASLARLNQPTDDREEFRRHVRFHLDHLQRFTTRPNQIPALRQTILNLAVRGLLTPQNPSDDSANDVVRRTALKRASLIETGAIKKDLEIEALKENDELFDIPRSWLWVRMAELCYPITSGSTPPKEVFQEANGIPFLKVYNIREQLIDFDYKPQYVDAEYHRKKMKRSTLRPGDVVMNIVGPPLGKVAIVPESFAEWNCNQAIVFFRPILSEINQFIYLFIKEGTFLQKIDLIGTAGQDNISVTKSKNIAVPLPPIAEQQRIVAKVDELMVICDELESHLTTAETDRRRLLEAVLYEALHTAANADVKAAVQAVPQPEVVAKPKKRKGLIFDRGAIASYAIDRLHTRDEFGTVQLEKTMYLTEAWVGFDMAGDYRRMVAGPLDPALYPLQGLAAKQKWFFVSGGKGQKARYTPGPNIADRCNAARAARRQAGGHGSAARRRREDEHRTGRTVRHRLRRLERLPARRQNTDR